MWDTYKDKKHLIMMSGYWQYFVKTHYHVYTIDYFLNFALAQNIFKGI